MEEKKSGKSLIIILAIVIALLIAESLFICLNLNNFKAKENNIKTEEENKVE